MAHDTDNGGEPIAEGGPAEARSGVLVIRLWREAGLGGFLARVIRIDDLPAGPANSSTLGDPARLPGLVRDWVAEMTET